MLAESPREESNKRQRTYWFLGKYFLTWILKHIS
jgi:hypothetical protein